MRRRRGELAHRHDDVKDKPLENVQGSIDDAVSAGWAFKADTIEALLQATLTRLSWSRRWTSTTATAPTATTSSRISRFASSQPVTTGPFYAFQYEPSAWVTIGGIRTNDRLQAIDGEGVWPSPACTWPATTAR